MELKDVQDSPASKGKTLYLKFLKGEQLSASQAIICNCFQCMNGHMDGRLDCEIQDCPCYAWMPYRKKESSTRKKKVISEENKEKMKKGLMKARKTKRKSEPKKI
jgi:hypothetical protein